MKGKIKLFLPLLLITVLLSGCTIDDPGYVIIDDSDPVHVLITGNPGVQVVDDDGNIIYIDATTGAIATIEYEHHEIHNGNMFTVLEVNDLGNGVVRDILIITPNTTKWAHLVWELEHELETSIKFYKDTTYSNNGTTIPSFNRNGNSTNVATTLVYHTPTITDVGTLIGIVQQGDGKKAGGADRESNEFILKQNHAYLMRITNLTVNDNLVAMKLNWYELTNRE